MFEIIFITCMLGSPTECREERIPFPFAGESVRQCAIYAPPQLAQWQENHPKWMVKRWKCGISGSKPDPRI